MDKTLDHLSRYVSTLRAEDIPAEVAHKVTRLTIDTLGCAIGSTGRRRRISA